MSANIKLSRCGRIIIFFNNTASTEIYALSLHDALPIFGYVPSRLRVGPDAPPRAFSSVKARPTGVADPGTGPPQEESDPCRSEEHTSELQSRQYLVCRLLLEKKTYFSFTH